MFVTRLFPIVFIVFTWQIVAEGSFRDRMRIIHGGRHVYGNLSPIDGTVRCGAKLCRPISGIFTKNHTPHGYVHVATIPAGASNISITELKHSPNYLVLKSKSSHKYSTNNEFKEVKSGAYMVAGTLFDYHRIDRDASNRSSAEKTLRMGGLSGGGGSGSSSSGGVTEWMTSIGPTTEAVDLLVFVKQANPEIKYEYLLPVDTGERRPKTNETVMTRSGDGRKPRAQSSAGMPSIEKPKRRYTWKIVGFNLCSRSCGGGTQTPQVQCVRENPLRMYPAERCAHLRPLNLWKRCNTQPCPAYWRTTNWTKCLCGSDREESFRTRDARCVQELGSGLTIQVKSGACFTKTPNIHAPCDCPKQLKMPPTEVYRHTGNKVQQQQPLIRPTPPSLYTNRTIAKRMFHTSEKRIGVWLVSDWNDECSSACGTGVQYRTIFCDRAPPNTERCDLRFTPETARQCTGNSSLCTQADWFAGPWGPCSGDCFNLTKSRSALCMRENLLVDNTQCDEKKRPKMLEECPIDEIKSCQPRWLLSEWTKCSKLCDGGTQRRVVKCFATNIHEKQMKEDKTCRYLDRPTAYRACNTQKCDEATLKSEENDIPSSN